MNFLLKFIWFFFVVVVVVVVVVFDWTNLFLKVHVEISGSKDNKNTSCKLIEILYLKIMTL